MIKKEMTSALVNSQAIVDGFANLYCRWVDERGYEDKKEYGKAMHSIVCNQFKDADIKLASTTTKPFGIKIVVDGSKVHLFLKPKGRYLVLCIKMVQVEVGV